jgi:hypothetical protein
MSYGTLQWRSASPLTLVVDGTAGCSDPIPSAHENRRTSGSRGAVRIPTRVAQDEFQRRAFTKEHLTRADDQRSWADCCLGRSRAISHSVAQSNTFDRDIAVQTEESKMRNPFLRPSTEPHNGDSHNPVQELDSIVSYLSIVCSDLSSSQASLKLPHWTSAFRFEPCRTSRFKSSPVKRCLRPRPRRAGWLWNFDQNLGSIPTNE